MDDDIVIISTTQTSKKSNKTRLQGGKGNSNEIDIVITDISRENRYSDGRINHMTTTPKITEENKFSLKTNTLVSPETPNSETQPSSFLNELNSETNVFKNTSLIQMEEINKGTIVTNNANDSETIDNESKKGGVSSSYFSYFKNLFTKNTTQNGDGASINDEEAPRKRFKYSSAENLQSNVLEEVCLTKDNLSTEKEFYQNNTLNIPSAMETQTVNKNSMTNQRGISLDERLKMSCGQFLDGKGRLNLISSLFGNDPIQEDRGISSTKDLEGALNRANMDINEPELMKQKTGPTTNDEPTINNECKINEEFLKIKIILKNRMQFKTFYLSENENLKKVFDAVVLGDKKIFFGGFVISKFSTPHILQMSTTSDNILEVKKPQNEQNGLLLRVNVSSSKTLEHTFPESVKLEDIINYVKEQGVKGKNKLVFNGILLKEEDLIDLDDGYCIDAV